MARLVGRPRIWRSLWSRGHESDEWRQLVSKFKSFSYRAKQCADNIPVFHYGTMRRHYQN